MKPNEVVPFTREQLGALLTACDQIGRRGYERARARALDLLMRYTGVRITDAYTLTRDRVRSDGQGRWYVEIYTPKTKGHVLNWIPVEVKAALDALPFPVCEDGTQVDRGYYFWTGNGTKQSAREIAWRLLRAVFTKANVKSAHPHMFRHTLATDILAKGGTLTDVADALAISETVAKKHYTKWTCDRQARLSSVLKAVYRGTPEVREEKSATIS